MDLFARKSDLLSHLESLGVTGAAAEAVARETAPMRAAARRERAASVALDAAYGLADCPPPAVGEEGERTLGYRQILAAGLCLLDALGVGGRHGVEGAATERIPSFGALGKGRKQATDGDAWDAAIGEARSRLLGGQALHVAPHVDGGLGLECGREPDSGSPEIGVPRDGVEGDPALRRWALTAAREGLRRSLGLDGWHEIPGVVWAGDPAAWGLLVNRAAVEPPPAECSFGAPETIAALRAGREAALAEEAAS